MPFSRRCRSALSISTVRRLPRGLMIGTLCLAAGVAFATILTLVLFPSLLAILNDFRLLVHRYKHGQWPRRLAVEPASTRHENPLAEGNRQSRAPSVDACPEQFSTH